MPNAFGLKKQAAWGVWEAPAKFLEIETGSFRNRPSRRYRRGIRTRGIREDAAAKLVAEGRVRTELNTLGGVADLMYALLGNKTSSQPDPVGNPGVWQHKFKPWQIGDAAWPFYSMELAQEGVTGRRIDSAVLNSATFNFDDVPLMDFEVLGRNMAKGPQTTPSWPTTAYFGRTDKINVQIGGVEVDLEALEFSVENNFSTDHQPIDSQYLPDHDPGDLSVRGRFSARFKNTSYFDDFINAAEKAFLLRLRGALISGSYHHEITWELPRIVYDAEEAATSRTERTVEDIEFEAMEGGADNAAIVITVQSTETGTQV